MKKQNVHIPKHLSYWQEQVPQADFNRWCGNPDSFFKKTIRFYIHQHDHRTILDVGAGTDSMYVGFQKDEFGSKVSRYVATDITEKYVKNLQDNGITALQCSAESMPFEENQFDCVICLDVLNHQLCYKEQIKELLRVSNNEVIITFFKCFEEYIGQNFEGTDQPLPGSTHAQGAKIEKTDIGTLEHRIEHKGEAVCVYHYFNRSKLFNFLESLEVGFRVEYTRDNVVCLFLRK